MLPSIRPTTVLAAADAAGTVIKQVGKIAESGLATFAEVLADETKSVVDDAGSSPVESFRELSNQIRKRLADSGVQVNESLEITVTDDGRVRIEAQHNQAAEIESVLAADSEVRSWAMEYRRSGGTQAARLEISAPDGLTEFEMQATMSRNRMTAAE